MYLCEDTISEICFKIIQKKKEVTDETNLARCF